jgi:hypothetical protein
MKTTLLVENNEELESFLSINLHTWVGTSIIPAKSAKFAIEHLIDNHESINLIITKSNISTERTAEAIDQYLKSNKLNIPLITIGKESLDSVDAMNIHSALDIKPIIKSSAQLLGVTAQDMAKQTIPEYFEIPVMFFRYITLPVTDVYKADIDNENQYEKYLDEFQTFPKGTIQNHIASGAEFLYVKKNDRLKFVTNITQEIAAKLSLKDLNPDEQVKAVELSHQLLQDKISMVGITDETVALATKTLKDMAKTAKNSNSIVRLLKRLMKNKAGYLFKHSQILMFMAEHLMDHLDWGNKEQVEKLQFVSLFHDIALENDVQAKIHSTEELRLSDLPNLKKELVKKHAQIGATLIASYPKAPMGSEMIIKQHHGITHGLGFSDHYGANLSPLTIVFILAEDFVDTLISSGDDFNITTKIEQMRKRYSTQRFQKIIDVLETATLIKK